MCYFIHLHVVPQRQSELAEALLQDLARRYRLYLEGGFPQFTVTDGHCSCDYVRQDGSSISVAEFLAEIVCTDAVKRIEVGWTWSEPLHADAAVERLPVEDFLARNEAKTLALNVRYRVNDPSKYSYSSQES